MLDASIAVVCVESQGVMPVLMTSLFTLSSIYTHFNTLKKKKKLGKHFRKGEIAQHEQFHLFP